MESNLTKNKNMIELLDTKENLKCLAYLIEKNFQKLKRIEIPEDYSYLNLEKILGDVAPEVFSLYPEDIKKNIPSIYQYSFFNKAGKHSRRSAEASIYSCFLTALLATSPPIIPSELAITSSIGILAMGCLFGLVSYTDNLRIKNNSYYIKPIISISPNHMGFYKLNWICAHELTHHLQHLNGLNVKNNNILLEGHARLTDRIVSENMAEKNNDTRYKYFSYSTILGELEYAYDYLSLDMKKQDNQPFFKKMFAETEINYHALGTAAFMILEEKYGQSILTDIMRQKYSKILTLNPNFNELDNKISEYIRDKY